MTPDDRTSPPSADRAGPLGQDLPCAGCGYNLRGLSADARCPECAFPIPESLAAHRAGACPLRLSDRPWLLKLAVGAACLFVAALTPYVAMRFGGQGSTEHGAFVASAWVFLACWLISSREPGTPPRSDPRVFRWILLACAVMPLLPQAWVLLQPGFNVDVPWAYAVNASVLVGPYFTIPASFLLYHRVSAIAGRMSDGPAVRWRARALRVVVPAGIVLVAAARRNDYWWLISIDTIAGVGVPAGAAMAVMAGLGWVLRPPGGIGPWPAVLALIVSGAGALWAAGFAAALTLSLARELLRRGR